MANIQPLNSQKIFDRFDPPIPHEMNERENKTMKTLNLCQNPAAADNSRCKSNANQRGLTSATTVLKETALFEFACLYCGQHMECRYCLCGRQVQCPACQHKIVIPPTPGQGAAGRILQSSGTWETCVPKPTIEIPIRYRDHSLNAVLAHPFQCGRTTEALHER